MEIVGEYPEAFISYLIEFHATRDYFECHELLEEYWKAHPGDPLAGLVQAQQLDAALDAPLDARQKGGVAWTLIHAALDSCLRHHDDRRRLGRSAHRAGRLCTRRHIKGDVFSSGDCPGLFLERALPAFPILPFQVVNLRELLRYPLDPSEPLLLDEVVARHREVADDLVAMDADLISDPGCGNGAQVEIDGPSPLLLAQGRWAALPDRT